MNTEGLTYDKSGHYKVTEEIAKAHEEAAWQDEAGQWWLSDEVGDEILISRGAMTLEQYTDYHGLTGHGNDPDMYIVTDKNSIYSDPESGRGKEVQEDGTVMVEMSAVFEDYYQALRDGDLGGSSIIDG